MSAITQNMASVQTVQALLTFSLDKSKAKEADASLQEFSRSPGFVQVLLSIVKDSTIASGTRLAAAIFFKNTIRKYWTDEDGNYLLALEDVTAIKSSIIEIMISLPPSLQAQVGEAISVIADSDFPDRWETLLPDLVQRLGTNYVVNIGVLTVAHSIFKRWRPLFRTDDLAREILFVLRVFAKPYLMLLEETHRRVQQASMQEELLQLLKTINLLIKIFYDLNCQDIPEFFEDHIKEFMSILLQYLQYKPTIALEQDENEVGVLEDIRIGICDIIQLYTQRYEEEFSFVLPTFVEACWNMLSDIGSETRYDLLVSSALAFLTSVVKLERYVHMMDSEDILKQLLERIVIPNIKMRPADEEIFEDEPIEFIRRDLQGSDNDTRRRAATDFLRELTTKLESRITTMVMSYIDEYLAEYAADPVNNWRYKNTASYLFAAIAAKGNVTSAGVSTTNLMIDVVGFFNSTIAPDLMNPNVHPILQVDAVRFIHNFRNQLTKEQLVRALPLLAQLLGSNEYTVYSYAAITIERILRIRQNGQPMFQQKDIEGEAEQLIETILRLIFRHESTPEKLAENEFLMECVMRVILTAREGIITFSEKLLKQLVHLVVVISANPSNPQFTHFLFESIGAVVTYAGQNCGYQKLEEIVVQPSLGILGQDVTEYMPYVLQILTKVLAIQPLTTFPTAYEQLFQPILSPSLWEPRGNVPALVGLLKISLVHGADFICKSQLLQALLGVFQNLLASKSRDIHGFALLEYIMVYVPPEALEPFLNQISQLILLRLQSSRTDQFVNRLSVFVYFLSACGMKPHLGPNFAIAFFDNVQKGVFGQILETFLLPATPKIRGNQDRRTAAFGLSKLLCETEAFGVGEYQNIWAPAAKILIALLKSNIAEEPSFVSSEIDVEDVTFGSSFSVLRTCAIPSLTLNSRTLTPAQFFASELEKMSESLGKQKVSQILSTLDYDSSAYFQSMGL